MCLTGYDGNTKKPDLSGQPVRSWRVQRGDDVGLSIQRKPGERVACLTEEIPVEFEFRVAVLKRSDMLTQRSTESWVRAESTLDAICPVCLPLRQRFHSFFDEENAFPHSLLQHV
ncbi:MAG: hypothetical protein ACYCVL_07120 [Gemmatimonadaceae bacterium]